MDRPIRTQVPPSFTGSSKSSTTTITTKTASVLNCRLRYALAPSWTARAISCIRGVPESARMTCILR